MLNPLLLGLAATATLLVLAVAVIVVALCRKHFTGRPGSPKHAPIVCEPPNTGATTPVHPQTKQAVDDIDPDIIPNEYGEFRRRPSRNRWKKSRVRIAPCARIYRGGNGEPVLFFCFFFLYCRRQTNLGRRTCVSLVKIPILSCECRDKKRGKLRNSEIEIEKELLILRNFAYWKNIEHCIYVYAYVYTRIKSELFSESYFVLYSSHKKLTKEHVP